MAHPGGFRAWRLGLALCGAMLALAPASALAQSSLTLSAAPIVVQGTQFSISVSGVETTNELLFAWALPGAGACPATSVAAQLVSGAIPVLPGDGLAIAAGPIAQSVGLTITSAGPWQLCAYLATAAATPDQSAQAGVQVVSATPSVHASILSDATAGQPYAVAISGSSPLPRSVLAFVVPADDPPCAASAAAEAALGGAIAVSPLGGQIGPGAFALNDSVTVPSAGDYQICSYLTSSPTAGADASDVELLTVEPPATLTLTTSVGADGVLQIGYSGTSTFARALFTFVDTSGRACAATAAAEQGLSGVSQLTPAGGAPVSALSMFSGKYGFEYLPLGAEQVCGYVSMAAGTPADATASATVALQTSMLTVPTTASALGSARSIAYLNGERAHWGIPGHVTEDPAWSKACAAHDNYERLNHVLQHPETPGAAGASAGGGWAGPHAILADGVAWTASYNPWEDSPLHLADYMNPDLLVTGADASAAGYQCMVTADIYGMDGPPGTVLTYPGNATSGLPPAENANELPFVPGKFVGVPLGTIAGRELFVYEQGATKVAIASASLTSAAGSAPLVWVDQSTPTVGPYLESAIIIPTHPLAPNTTYQAQVTLKANGALPAVTHSWRFTTGPANPSGRWPAPRSAAASTRAVPQLQLSRSGHRLTIAGSLFAKGTVVLHITTTTHFVQRVHVAKSGSFSVSVALTGSTASVLATQGSTSVSARLGPR